MIVALLGGLAAGAVTTWAFLRPRGAVRAEQFPSLQLLRGAVPQRRRLFALEDPIGWALRMLALAASVAGFGFALVEAAQPALAPVVLVDPATGAAGRALAAQESSGAVLGFDGERPLAQGVLGPWLEPTLRECSASRKRCLARAAAKSGRAVVVVGARSRGWEGLEAIAQPIAWIEAPVGEEAVEAAPAAGPAVTPKVVRRGASPEAVLWAAALESAAPMAGGPAQVEVLDGDAPRASAGSAVLVVRSSASAPRDGWPPVLAQPVEGARFSDVPRLAVGAGGVVLRGTLAWAEGMPGESVAGRVLISRATPTQRAVAAAATAEELARWAHEGQLALLAKAVLAQLGPGPLEFEGAPPFEPSAQYTDGQGHRVPVGVAAVGPGVYSRSDLKVRARLARSAEATAPEWTAPSAREAPGALAWVPALAFAVAAAALALALVRRLRLLALLPGGLALAVLGLAAFDFERQPLRTVERVVRLSEGARFAAPRLRAQGLRIAGLEEPLPCLAPRALAPCEVVATVAAAADAPALVVAAADAALDRGAGLAIDGLLFALERPRVDVLGISAPASVPLGAAARLEVAVRVQRAKGKQVRAVARPLHGAAVERALTVAADDEVRALSFEVVPLLAGMEQVVLEVRVEEAEDAQRVALTVDARQRRRALLVGAPGWEARFAAAALRARGGGETASLTRVGASAVQAVGLARVDPLRWLESGALDATDGGQPRWDTVVVTGFGRGELDGAPARALRAFVERGGAVLLLGGEGAQALGWPSLGGGGEGPLARTAGDLLDGTKPVEVLATPAAVVRPAGAQVLATLGEGRRPWMLGRDLGEGRVAAIVAAELFRSAPPAGAGEEAERALFHALAWVEAPRARPDAGPARVEAPPPMVVRRAALREEAAREGRPFFEVDGAEELASAMDQLPQRTPAPYPAPVRRDGLAIGVLFALAALEATLQRRAAKASGSSSSATR